MRLKLSFSSLVFGLPLFGLVLCIAYQYFVRDISRELADRDLVKVSGSVLRTEALKSSKGVETTKVWLTGYDHPFLFDQGFVLRRLAAGTKLEVGLLAEELAKPRVGSKTNGLYFRTFTARLEHGAVLIDLTSYNNNARSMKRWLPWLMFWLGVAGWILCTEYAAKEIQRGRYGPPQRIQGNQLTIRLGGHRGFLRK